MGNAAPSAGTNDSATLAAPPSPSTPPVFTTPSSSPRHQTAKGTDQDTDVTEEYAITPERVDSTQNTPGNTLLGRTSPIVTNSTTILGASTIFATPVRRSRASGDDAPRGIKSAPQRRQKYGHSSRARA